MIAPVRPRALVHRGSLVAVGLVVDPALVGAVEAKRRVLAAWCAGARVFAVADSFAVLWPSPRRVRAEEAPGTLLVPAGRSLAAAPLVPAELERLAPPPAACVLVRQGVAEAVPWGEEIDVASWVDVDDATFEQATPLVTPPAQVVEVAAVASEARATEALRAVVGPPAPEREAIARALSRAPAEPSRSRFGVLSSLWTALATLFARREGAPARGSDLAVARRAENDAGRLWGALRRAIAQALVQLRLARVVGRWHAQYLGKMLDLFDKGDLEAALRHAIPLGGEGAGSAPALLPPQPRSSLELTAGTGGASTSIGLVSDLYADLTRRYRAAFEELDRRGDVERAAFVLAELLRVTAEAVAYLEEHRRFALAAELAEARGLAPALVVRLWFRAGQMRRAIALARRHGCHEAAIAALRERDPEAADALTVAWASACADAGDYVAAARIGRFLPAARGLVATWLGLALEQEGEAAVLASVLLVELDPGAFVPARARATALLADRRPLAQAARQALYEALATSSSPLLAPLARAAARAAILDGPLTAKAHVEALVRRSGDGALRLHVANRPVPTGPSPAATAPKAHHRAAMADLVKTFDAAMVAGDRLLVALGELGVWLMALDGRRLARFEVPATALVVSPRGDRALAVVRRDGALSVARIDVVRRRIEPWGRVQGDVLARTFDGATWFIGRGEDVVALDATVQGFEGTVHPQSDPVVHLDARARELVVAVAGSRDRHASVYDLPSLTLRRRLEIDALAAWCEVVPGGHAYGGLDVRRPLVVEPQPLAFAYVQIEGPWWCVSGMRPSGTWVVRAGTSREGTSGETCACTFDGAASARLQGRFVVVESGGRVLVVDAVDGALVAEVRLGV